MGPIRPNRKGVMNNRKGNTGAFRHRQFWTVSKDWEVLGELLVIREKGQRRLKK